MTSRRNLTLSVFGARKSNIQKTVIYSSDLSFEAPDVGGNVGETRGWIRGENTT